jgi:hypothetical protein
MAIAKSCADHIRAYHATLFPQKLKATHAHEIVAAILGYKTASAMNSEREFPVDDLLGAQYMALRVDMLEQRLTELSGLPATMLTPTEMASEIGNFLRFGLGCQAHMPLILRESLLKKGYSSIEHLLADIIVDHHISVRSLARLSPAPTDPKGQWGSTYGGPMPFFLAGLAKANSEPRLVKSAGGISAAIEFDAEAERLQQDPWPADTPSPWYRIDAQIDRHGARSGYRVQTMVMSNPKGDSLDLIETPPAPNLTNPFDHPEAGEIDELFISREDAKQANNPLMPGTTLILNHPCLTPTRLSDGRPNTGQADAFEREKKEGLRYNSLQSGWSIGDSSDQCPYWYKRKSKSRMTLKRPMSWSEAIIEMNNLRALNEPVGVHPRMFYLEAIKRQGERSYHLQVGT